MIQDFRFGSICGESYSSDAPSTMIFKSGKAPATSAESLRLVLARLTSPLALALLISQTPLRLFVVHCSSSVTPFFSTGVPGWAWPVLPTIFAFEAIFVSNLTAFIRAVLDSAHLVARCGVPNRGAS
jgi:hypothetical protein